MYKRTTLLTTNNFKTLKGEKFKDATGKPYKTYILYMSPYTQNSKGINLCPHASAGCAASCLFNSGFGGMYKKVANARINKSEWYLQDRDTFMVQLDKEVGAAIKRHPEYNVVFRLNGTTDIRWEKIKIRDNKNIFELYPRNTFYDYTKNNHRLNIQLPSNYHLTFSRSENNDATAMKLLSEGHNVAIVFGETPSTYMGYEVVNGDLSDLRFADKKGVVVGLKYKFATGKNADNKTAFVSGFAI